MISPNLTERLAELQPDILTHLQAATAVGSAAADPAALALCTDYLDAALNCRDWVAPNTPLDEKQEALIRFTEQFAMSVSTLESASVEALLAFYSADEVYALVHALYLADMSARMDLVGKAVLQ